jgi:hypothetical protein
LTILSFAGEIFHISPRGILPCETP